MAALAYKDQKPVVVEPKKPRKDHTHWLYIMVIVAVVAGIILGLTAPETAKEMKWLGTAFVNLIKMMIAPVIFCTIVLGIGSVKAAASVGKAGGMALAYFIVMSTFALFIGLFVGNIVQPGAGLTIEPGAGAEYASQAGAEAEGLQGLIMSIIPTTLVSALTEGSVLKALFIALLVGFAVQRMGKQGEPILRAIATFQKLVFRVLIMVLWVAPIGAFGAIAAVVGGTGPQAIASLGLVMLAFYITCILFIVIIMGGALAIFARINIFKLMKYLGREYLLIVATSSSESALPNLMAKMEHAGVGKSTVGIVVPTGYSFNLDGTAIYLTMSAVFISEAMHMPMNIAEQAGLLVFMIIASKGAAGVSGAGLATLAGGLQSFRPEMLDGVGVVVGIDRFMSEARALTNFTGNAVATFIVGQWTHTLDHKKAQSVLNGTDKFDYSTLGEDGHHVPPEANADLSMIAPTPVNPADQLTPTPMPILPKKE